MSERYLVKITVKELVALFYRSGDLEMDFQSPARAREGTLIHSMIQKSRPDNYTPEVRVNHTVADEKVLLEVSGRIDGVFQYENRTVIEEIKTTYLDLDALEDSPVLTHLGQLKCYGLMFALEKGMDSVDLQLTYYSMITRKSRELSWKCGTDELQDFYHGVVQRFINQLKLDIRWQERRNESARLIQFPYPVFRDQQRAMSVWIYRTIVDGRHLLVQAPTGTGKTIAALFPAVKAIGEGKLAKIFYLAARSTGKEIAENSLQKMRETGLSMRSITLTAKDKICFCPDHRCESEDCEYARAYYDKLSAAIEEAREYQSFTRDCITDLARKHEVCPFEFSLDLSMISDCIICDYNYVFDPRVYLKRYFMDPPAGDYTFLIDEAHNLVDRSRDMYSAQLDKKEFMELGKLVKGTLKETSSITRKINRWFLKSRKTHCAGAPFVNHPDQPEELYRMLDLFLLNVEETLLKGVESAEISAGLLDIYFKARQFRRISAFYSDRYQTCYSVAGSNVTVKLLCLDPSEILKECLKRSKSSVFFSATMTPCSFFNHSLGMNPDTKNLSLPSTFPAANLKMMICGTVSTRYRERSKSIDQVMRYIKSFVKSRKGNYLVFFPSYEYLGQVLQAFEESLEEKVTVMVQNSGMSETEREEFLQKFQPDPEQTNVGFAVMGGVFGEGIDLYGERLNGVVIVGVGLPGISSERDLIKDYFAADGFDYAYLYPGFLRVMQASGRLIRSETDRGAILLIEKRFLSSQYQKLFPAHWDPEYVSSVEDMEYMLDRFWNS